MEKKVKRIYAKSADRKGRARLKRRAQNRAVLGFGAAQGQVAGRIFPGKLYVFRPILAVAAWGDAKEFTELAAEMLYVVVAAVLGDLADGFCRGNELVLGAL